MALVPRGGLVAVRFKAVLKHAQSKRWRDVRCGPVNAKSNWTAGDLSPQLPAIASLFTTPGRTG